MRKVYDTRVISIEGQSENASMYHIWIRGDKAPVVAEFTGNPGVMINLPLDPRGHLNLCFLMNLLRRLLNLR